MKIAVLGAGNMGRWIVRELAPDHEVSVYDPVLSRTEGLGNQASIARDLDAIAAFEPGLLINSVSLKNTIAAFEAAVPALSPDCILVEKKQVRPKGAFPVFHPVESLCDSPVKKLKRSGNVFAAIRHK